MRFFSLLLAAAVLLLPACTTSRPRATKAAYYRFKAAPAYMPGPKPYVHERYPNHP